MNPYRIKHIPTGLYYQPARGGNNLSTKGKVYFTALSPLTSDNGIYLSVRSDSIVYKKSKDIIAWVKPKYGRYNEMCYYADKEQWIKEEL